ncbi:hypothetical protein [Saccharopolyspora griseoalba]|uniref:ASCH domain-containing protein n=1 Tax=Saccharopolyspora griseoalba TaxID=1431848 RepID=A0ABW2LF53_9PSEU
MFSDRVARAVAAGEVTEAYRRAPRRPAEPGDRVRTVAGLVGITEVTEVDPGRVSDEQARCAGFNSAAGLRSSLAKHGTGPVFRLRLVPAGPGEPPPPEPVVLDDGRRRVIEARLARLDADSPRGPWTADLLGRLSAGPVRAAELAAQHQRPVSRCKSQLWRLRELGLVESVAAGMRLTGLGVAYVRGR